jgi:hypothetical protein
MNQIEALGQYPEVTPLYAEFHWVTARYGLQRNKIYSLINGGYIRSKKVITKDDLGEIRSRGRTLIHIPSLEAYLDSLPG